MIEVLETFNLMQCNLVYNVHEMGLSRQLIALVLTTKGRKTVMQEMTQIFLFHIGLIGTGV